MVVAITIKKGVATRFTVELLVVSAFGIDEVMSITAKELLVSACPANECVVAGAGAEDVPVAGACITFVF